jgi:hypothetical protein
VREQPDTTPDFILAVFKSPEHARRVVRRLSEMVPDRRAIDAVPLGPGLYPLADINRGVEVRAAIRGAARWAPIGAIVGLAFAALLPGVGPFAAVGATAAGALAGLAVGGADGAMKRVRWGEHGLALLEVLPGSNWTLVIVNTSAIPDSQRLGRLLERGGAMAFLEPTAYFAAHRERPAS